MKANNKVKLAALLLLAALTLTLLPSCSSSGQYQTVYYDLFDTVTVIQGYAASSKDYNEGVQALRRELLECHRLFDIYNEYDGLNNLATVNKNAGGEPIAVDFRVIELLDFARQKYSETDGALNIAMGSLLRVWHNYRTADNNELPSSAELEEAAGHISMESLVIDRESSTVYLSDPEASLDAGALAKGYACDRARTLLEDTLIESACINLGGNVLTYGEKPDGEEWTLGIPDGKGNTLFSIELSGKSVVTSGDYHRYYTVDGTDYHHIIDPSTLYPSTLHRQVTVIGESSALADALSTALFVLDTERGMQIADKAGVAVIWIEKDGEVIQNEKALEYTEGRGADS